MTPLRQNILVIDDSPVTQSMLARQLADEGLLLSSATSPIEGLQVAATLRPDLILLDVEMPEMDGWEVCRRLKSEAATREIPIIFLTGNCSEEQKITGLDLGAVDYISKPCGQGELQARVRAALRTKYLMDLLARRAMVDGLTGLWNRAYFDQRLLAESASAARRGTPLSCVMCDIDYFKSINDTHGHACGDHVLREVAQMLGALCRTEDVVCRYGGEEFVILAPNCSVSAAAVLARRLCETIRETPVRHSGKLIRITSSFGVAELSRNPDFIEAADLALYAAKANGRNQVHIAAGRNMVAQHAGIDYQHARMPT